MTDRNDTEDVDAQGIPSPQGEHDLIETDFERVDEVRAAAGIKIAAPDLDGAMAGAPIRIIRDRDRSEVIAEVEACADRFSFVERGLSARDLTPIPTLSWCTTRRRAAHRAPKG